MMNRMLLPMPRLSGYTALILASEYEGLAHSLPEPYKAQFELESMRLYHQSAIDENERRDKGDAPDHMHLTYL